MTASIAKLVGGAPAYCWSFPGGPIRVRIEHSVIRAIRKEMQEPVVHPVGGILLGSTQGGQTVTIRDHRPLTKGDRTDLAETLRELQNSAPATDRRPVGFYVVDERDALRLDAAHVELAEQFFPAPQSVVLLVQTGHGRVPNASFFFWDSGQFLGDFAFLEFPFDPALLPAERPAEAPRKHAEAAAGTTPPSQGRRARLPVAVVAGGLALGAGVASLLWYRPAWLTRDTASSSDGAATDNSRDRATTPVSRIGLKAERSSGDFRITWDRDSDLVRQAEAGVLLIEEGNKRREFPLSTSGLRGGLVVLQPRGEFVTVQLSLKLPQGRSEAESVLLLLSGGGQPVVQTLPPVSRQAEERARAANEREPESVAAVPRQESAQQQQQQTPTQQARMFTPAERAARPPVTQPELQSPVIPSVDTASLPARSPNLNTFQVPAPPAASNTAELRPQPQGQQPPAAAPPKSTTEAAAVRPPPSSAPGSPSNGRPTIYTGASPSFQPRPAMTSLLRSMVVRPTSVTVRVKIDERGVVTAAQAVRGPGTNPYLATVSEVTARGWRYHPAKRDGQPMASESTIEFQFKP